MLTVDVAADRLSTPFFCCGTQGGQARILDTFLHELGHNLGLQHSSTPGLEYGDMSSPMGNCCDSPRCALAWVLAWPAVTGRDAPGLVDLVGLSLTLQGHGFWKLPAS